MQTSLISKVITRKVQKYIQNIEVNDVKILRRITKSSCNSNFAKFFKEMNQKRIKIHQIINF